MLLPVVASVYVNTGVAQSRVVPTYFINAKVFDKGGYWIS